MADTYSSSLGYIIMGVGGDNNTWGTNLNNSVFQILEDSIANVLTTTASAGALGPSNILDLSTSPPPAGPSAARYAALVFAGAITANQTVKVPNLTKFWWVKNATSGAFTVTMQTPSGSPSSAIPQNSGWQLVHCDGANVIIVEPFNSLQVQMNDRSAAAPAYSFINETNSGWYRAGTQDVRLAINGSDVLQITGVGAGTPSVVNVLSPNALQQAGTPIRGFSTGDVKLTLKTVADSGWVMMNDSTIGDASSNASYANANASALFQLLYNNLSDADAPILTSGGAATTRGAQGPAATAFANHCRLTLPLALGRALAVSGIGSGLTSRSLGHALGEETHTLSTAEVPTGLHSINNPTHVHPGIPNVGNGSIGGGGVGNLQTAATVSGTINSGAAAPGLTLTDNAGGGAHNNMQPTTFLNVMICL
jgi:microcystin-dependent protein